MKLASVAAALNQMLRPVVTYAFASAVIAGFLVGKIGADVFTTMASGVILFWFGNARTEQRASDQERPPAGGA